MKPLAEAWGQEGGRGTVQGGVRSKPWAYSVGQAGRTMRDEKRITSWKGRTGGQVRVRVKGVEVSLGKMPSVMVDER